jgi:spermidine/putrescine transport system permease protein
VLVWGLMRRGIDPSINAIATMLFALLACLVIASNILNRKKAS